jgi:hypothetical protein
MEPYYSDEWVTLYHGDCRGLLGYGAWFPTGQGIRLITDPPYEDWIAPMLGEWVWHDYDSVAVFGYPELLVSWCVDGAVKPDEWVTWAPVTPHAGSGGDKLPRTIEAIAVFGQVHGGRRLMRERSQSGKRLAHFTGRPKSERRESDLWSDPEPGIGFNAHPRLHPNEKPASLLRKLVLLLTDEGDTIIDPFCGSGTTLRAAKDLGRKAIGIEIEERYCEVAARRMGQEVMAL